MKHFLLFFGCLSFMAGVASANDSIYPPQPAAATNANFDGRGFIINGQRTFIASGSIHYPRVPSALWHDRLLRLKRSGLNCVQTYAFWNFHELQEGQLDFTGDKDFNGFLQEAHNLGLYATVRPGAYVCAEWEGGGYPNWFMQKANLSLRVTNAAYLAGSDEWYSHIMPIIASNQINHGGSVIMVQLENEHQDCWGTDTVGVPYFQHLRTNALSYGIEVPMFFSGLHHSSDPAGTTPWDSVGRDSPWYSTEYWVVWYDHYNESASDVSTFDRRTWKIVAYGGNGFNDYLFHGGTDFDHWNGSEVAASYDYGAAIGQAGDLRTLYYRFKRCALFSRTFQSILENSVNATSSYSGAASGGVGITARSSPAGNIVFLDNNSANQVTSTLSGALNNGAQIKLDPYEIVPIVKNFSLAPGITLEEADGRILCAPAAGNTTTLVTYGIAAETPHFRFLLSVPVTNLDAAFIPDVANTNRLLFNPTVPASGPNAYSFSAGGRTIRVLVMSKTMADRTWQVDAAGTNYVICGPEYVGDVTNINNKFSLELEAPLSSTLPTNVLVYDFGVGPRNLAVSTPVSSGAVTAPALVNWQMRSGALPGATVFDDSAWLASTNPLPTGTDGDPGNYAWYRAQVTVPSAGTYYLQFAGIADWGVLYVNGNRVALSQPVSQAAVSLQAGVNTLAIFTSHYGRSKFFSMYGGPSSVGFENKGLWSPVGYSSSSLPSSSITSWYWKLVGATLPSNIAQITDPNFNPSANGWSTGGGWNTDIFNGALGYAWYRTTLPTVSGSHHTIQFASMDDNATLYLNGTNIVGTHGGWGLPFVVNLDSAWNPGGTNVLTVLLQNVGGGAGISGAATLQNYGTQITGWKMHGGLDPIDGPGVTWGAVGTTGSSPVFYRAQFNYQPPAGIQPILRVLTNGLSRGCIWLNGHNLGRFPEKIPINGLYLPECWLNTGTNTLIVFDESGNSNSQVALTVETAASRKVGVATEITGNVVISQTQPSGSNFVLTVPSFLNRSYQLQQASAIPSPSWTPVGNTQTGTGNPLTFTIPVNGALSQNYYRVQMN